MLCQSTNTYQGYLRGNSKESDVRIRRGPKIGTILNDYDDVDVCCTVWKFHDFSITQILREINFGDSRSAKSAILTHLEALNFDFYGILHFLKAEIYQKDKTQSP